MAKYHLVHIESKGTFFNLSRLEMVNKLKQVKDLPSWFCWYPGLAHWKQVSQAQEIKEWMTIPWTEDQPMPSWQELFTRRGKTNEDFEVVEFNESPSLTPPPPPSEKNAEKTEFVISGFSGQIFDFDETTNGKAQPSANENFGKFENTVKVDAGTDFDKTIASSTQLISDKTVIIENLNNVDLDKTVVSADKTQIIHSTATDFDKTVSGTTQLITEKTVKVDTSVGDFDNTVSATTNLSTEQTITATIAPSFDNTSKITVQEKETLPNQPPPPPHVTGNVTPPPAAATANFPSGANKPATPPTPSDLGKAATASFVKKHDRRYPRVKGRLRTIITNKSKAFMTFTKDISLGGIQVENLIPHDILNSEIEVYLSDPTGKKSILFRCHPVGDMKNPCRFSFAKADEKSLLKLSQWLDDLAKIGAA